MTIIFRQDDTDIIQIITEVKQAEPFVIRLTSNESFQYMLVAEGRVLLESENGEVKDFYKLIFAIYYTFNFSYPNFLSTALIYIQHYILNIPHSTMIRFLEYLWLLCIVLHYYTKVIPSLKMVKIQSRLINLVKSHQKI